MSQYITVFSISVCLCVRVCVHGYAAMTRTNVLFWVVHVAKTHSLKKSPVFYILIIIAKLRDLLLMYSGTQNSTDLKI